MYDNNVMKGCCAVEQMEPMEPMVALTDNIRSVGIAFVPWLRKSAPISLVRSSAGRRKVQVPCACMMS